MMNKRLRLNIQAFAICWMLIGVLLLSGCRESEKSYQKGLQNYAISHYQDAVHDYKLAISQGNESAEVYADLALSELRLGQTEEALKNLNTALGKAPDSPLIQKKIGIFYRDIGDAETALRFMRAALPAEDVKLGEEDLDTIGLAAGLMTRTGAYEEAIGLYTRLLAAEYHVLEHDILIGETYLRMSQVFAACQYFDLAAEKTEARPEHFLEIRRALLAVGEKREAKRYYMQGMERCGKNGSMSRGEYALAAGEAEEAMEYFQDADSVQARLCKAMCLENEGSYDEAEILMEQLVREAPDSMMIANRYLMLKAKKGDFDSAFQLLTHIYASSDEAVIRDAHFNEVILYEMMEDYDQAFQKAKEYRDMYPLDAAIDRVFAFLSRTSL